MTNTKNVENGKISQKNTQNATKNEQISSKKLNIAMFCDSFFPMMDGVAMVMDNYARLMLQRGHKVTMFVPQGRTEFDDSTLPYKVVRCHKIMKVSFLDYDLPLPKKDSAFLRAAMGGKFDVIHLHSPMSIGRVGLEVAKKKNIPAIFHAHSQYKRDIYRSSHSHIFTHFMLKSLVKVINGCDECWPVNNRVGLLFKDYGVKIPMVTQNNGTDFKTLEGREEKIAAIRAEFGVKNDEKLLLFVGRLNILKNILLICDSLKILKDKGFKFKMVYVGVGQDEGKLRKRIKKHHLENEVILTGKILDRERLTAIYAAADLFTFPSLYDANSLVQIEAASQGTPTLFVEGAVTSGNATYEVDSYATKNNAKAYANKIIEIFADEEKYKKVCAAAKANLCVTWAQSVEKAEGDYLRVAQKQTGRNKNKK